MSIGARDSFTAAVTIGLLSGWPIETPPRSGRPCRTSSGAVPDLPEAIRSRFAPAIGHQKVASS
jgi:hypothetical protein